MVKRCPGGEPIYLNMFPLEVRSGSRIAPTFDERKPPLNQDKICPPISANDPHGIGIWPPPPSPLGGALCSPDDTPENAHQFGRIVARAA